MIAASSVLGVAGNPPGFGGGGGALATFACCAACLNLGSTWP